MGKNKKVSNSDTKQTDLTTEDSDTEQESGSETQNDESKKEKAGTVFAYIGPELPNSRLKSNAIIIGTYGEVTEHYKDIIEDYPQVATLIIPVSELSAARKKIKSGGNLLNNYCKEIAETIKMKGEIK